MAKRFSLATAFIVISLVGLTPAGAQTLVDGAFSLISTDDSVLQVTNLDDGTFKVEFVGPGEAKLVASADADLSDGVRQIYQEFEFLIYNVEQEADHIDLIILDTVSRAAVDTLRTTNVRIGMDTVPRAAVDDVGGEVAIGEDAAADAASSADGAAGADTTA